MALINKPQIENALRQHLAAQLKIAAEEMITESGGQISDEVRNAITRYSNKQAAKMAIAINVALTPVYNAIDENTNNITQLQSQINGLTSALSTTP